jgi:glycerophosphoryl diester phosphodiesterase
MMLHCRGFAQIDVPMGFHQHRFGQCLIIGHRGAAGLAPENTLPAFALAARHCADAIELDIRFAHNILWVIHDATLDRTTDAVGRLEDHTAAQLRRVNAGGGAHLPTLEQVLEATPAEIGINIELKGAGCAAPLAVLLQGYPGRDLLVSAFSLEELYEFQRLCPHVRRAPLFSRWHTDLWDIARDLGSWSINLPTRLASVRRVDRAHAIGLRLMVYTVNQARVAQRLIGYGVDGVFTDYPDGRLTRRPDPD